MKFETMVKKLKSQAKNNDWVVITKDGDIWGSEASVSSIAMGGRKHYILNACDIIRYDDISYGIQCALNHENYSFEEIYNSLIK